MGKILVPIKTQVLFPFSSPPHLNSPHIYMHAPFSIDLLCLGTQCATDAVFLSPTTNSLDASDSRAFAESTTSFVILVDGSPLLMYGCGRGVVASYRSLFGALSFFPRHIYIPSLTAEATSELATLLMAERGRQRLLLPVSGEDSARREVETKHEEGFHAAPHVHQDPRSPLHGEDTGDNRRRDEGLEQRPSQALLTRMPLLMNVISEEALVSDLESFTLAEASRKLARWTRGEPVESRNPSEGEEGKDETKERRSAGRVHVGEGEPSPRGQGPDPRSSSLHGNLCHFVPLISLSGRGSIDVSECGENPRTKEQCAHRTLPTTPSCEEADTLICESVEDVTQLVADGKLFPVMYMTNNEAVHEQLEGEEGTAVEVVTHTLFISCFRVPMSMSGSNGLKLWMCASKKTHKRHVMESVEAVTKTTTPKLRGLDSLLSPQKQGRRSRLDFDGKKQCVAEKRDEMEKCQVTNQVAHDEDETLLFMRPLLVIASDGSFSVSELSTLSSSLPLVVVPCGAATVGVDSDANRGTSVNPSHSPWSRSRQENGGTSVLGGRVSDEPGAEGWSTSGRVVNEALVQYPSSLAGFSTRQPLTEYGAEREKDRGRLHRVFRPYTPADVVVSLLTEDISNRRCTDSHVPLSPSLPHQHHQHRRLCLYGSPSFRMPSHALSLIRGARVIYASDFVPIVGEAKRSDGEWARGSKGPTVEIKPHTLWNGHEASPTPLEPMRGIERPPTEAASPRWSAPTHHHHNAHLSTCSSGRSYQLEEWAGGGHHLYHSKINSGLSRDGWLDHHYPQQYYPNHRGHHMEHGADHSSSLPIGVAGRTADASSFAAHDWASPSDGFHAISRSSPLLFSSSAPTPPVRHYFYDDYTVPSSRSLHRPHQVPATSVQTTITQTDYSSLPSTRKSKDSIFHFGSGGHGPITQEIDLNEPLGDVVVHTTVSTRHGGEMSNGGILANNGNNDTNADHKSNQYQSLTLRIAPDNKTTADDALFPNLTKGSQTTLVGVREPEADYRRGDKACQDDKGEGAREAQFVADALPDSENRQGSCSDSEIAIETCISDRSSHAVREDGVRGTPVIDTPSTPNRAHELSFPKFRFVTFCSADASDLKGILRISQSLGPSRCSLSPRPRVSSGIDDDTFTVTDDAVHKMTMLPTQTEVEHGAAVRLSLSGSPFTAAESSTLMSALRNRVGLMLSLLDNNKKGSPDNKSPSPYRKPPKEEVKNEEEENREAAANTAVGIGGFPELAFFEIVATRLSSELPPQSIFQGIPTTSLQQRSSSTASGNGICRTLTTQDECHASSNVTVDAVDGDGAAASSSENTVFLVRRVTHYTDFESGSTVVVAPCDTLSSHQLLPSLSTSTNRFLVLEDGGKARISKRIPSPRPPSGRTCNGRTHSEVLLPSPPRRIKDNAVDVIWGRIGNTDDHHNDRDHLIDTPTKGSIDAKDPRTDVNDQANIDAMAQREEKGTVNLTPDVEQDKPWDHSHHNPQPPHQTFVSSSETLIITESAASDNGGSVVHEGFNSHVGPNRPPPPPPPKIAVHHGHEGTSLPTYGSTIMIHREHHIMSSTSPLREHEEDSSSPPRNSSRFVHPSDAYQGGHTVRSSFSSRYLDSLHAPRRPEHSSLVADSLTGITTVNSTQRQRPHLASDAVREGTGESRWGYEAANKSSMIGQTHVSPSRFEMKLRVPQ